MDVKNMSSRFNIHRHFQEHEPRERLKKRYLFSYNVLQTFGWSLLLLRVIIHYLLDPEKVLYDEIKYILIFFQNVAFLEILHAHLKLTSSNPKVTFQQIYSRIMIVCTILMPLQEPRTSIGFTMLLTAWSITEIIRYSNYALGTIGRAPKDLIWLRYTAFIYLYPLGVSGELICMWAGVSEVIRTKQWCIEFPNNWNVMFYYHHHILLNMFLYIPYFPQLYMHMFTLRRKVLGSLNEKTK